MASTSIPTMIRAGMVNATFSINSVLICWSLKPKVSRIAANRVLEKNVGREDFMLKIIPYPHQVIREHKRVNVAQADRFQEGMKRAWGKPTYVAARIMALKPIIIAEVNKEGIVHAKEALKRASAKFPSKCRIVVNEL